MQFIPVSLKALKPKETDFESRTLGEHIKKRRLTLKFYQREVTKLLGVDLFTVINWEKGRTEPPVRVIPAILAFLGYDPCPAPTTLSERMLAARRTKGWTMKEAAQSLGLHEATWQSWEHSGSIKWKLYRAKVESLLSELKL